MKLFCACYIILRTRVLYLAECVCVWRQTHTQHITLMLNSLSHGINWCLVKRKIEQLRCVYFCVYIRDGLGSSDNSNKPTVDRHMKGKKRAQHTHTHFPAIRLERSFHHCADETTNNTMLCCAAEYRNLLLHYEMVFAFILFLLRCNPDNWTESKCHVD